MIDAAGDQTTADDPRERISAIHDGAGDAGKRDGQRHRAGTDERGATGGRAFGDGPQVDALGLVAIFGEQAVEFRMHFAAGMQHERAPLRVFLAEERERLDQGGEDLTDRLRPAAGQEQDRTLRVILQPMLMVGLSEGMADETGVQLGVGVYRRLEREDRADAIQVARHGEATLGLPSPELRADVLDDGGLAEAGARQAGLAQFVREAQVQAGIVHEDDDLRLPLRGPADHAREEPTIERIGGEHLDDAHGRETGHVQQQLGARGA